MIDGKIWHHIVWVMYDEDIVSTSRESLEKFIRELHGVATHVKNLSAKGSLKQARDPKYQALFAIRGVSANVYRLTLDQIVGPKGNKEFTDLITVMGCNVGAKFDLSKLQYNKIIIASDADKRFICSR